MKTRIALSLALASLVAGCISTHGQVLAGRTYAARVEGHPVLIYDLLEDVPVPCEKIALVSADGAPLASWDGMVQELQERARRLGGDALVLRAEGSHPHGSVGYASRSGWIGTAMTRGKHMSALVVRFVDPEALALR